jgi:hypothetical protein
MMPGMNPHGIRTKLPAEQMSDATASPEVRFRPIGAGSAVGGKRGIEAGSDTVVRCGLPEPEAGCTGAALPGEGTVNWV